MKKWQIILLGMVMILISCYSALADKVVFNEDENWVQYENFNFQYRLPLYTTCQYKYCPITFNFWTSSSQCIYHDDIFMPYGFELEHKLNYIVDDSYTIDTTLFQCTCNELIDEMTNETYCDWGVNNIHINLTEWFMLEGGGELPPTINDKKEYCYDNTKIYTQDYYDYLDGKFCANAGYNTYQAYFLADKDSSGKYDICLTLGLTDYCIDPYWNTTASNWENGTFNFTEEAVTGELQINDSIEYPNNKGSDLNRNMSKNVLLWHLNNDSAYGDNGTRAYDYSGSGNNGTIEGGANRWITSAILGDYSINMSGANGDFINTVLAKESNFDFTTEFTTSIWLYPHTSKIQNVISKWYDGNRAWGWYLNADEQIVFTTSDAGSDTDTLTSTGAVNLNEWNHVITTFDNGDKTIYINGKFAGSNTGGSPIYNNNEQLIIACNYQGQYCFDGFMDELAIWNRSLSASEVRNLYSAQKGYYESEVFDAGASVQWDNISFTIDSMYNAVELPDNMQNDSSYILNSPLMSNNIGLYHFDSDTEANDTSGNANHGTYIGTASLGVSNSVFGDKSVYLDGNSDSVNINSTLNNLSTTTTGTWSAWVYSGDVTPSAPAGIIGFGDTNANERIQFYVYSNQVMAILTDAGTNAWQIKTDAGYITDNTWYHVALVHDGTTPYIYINGIEVPHAHTITTDNTKWFNDCAGLDTARIGGINFNSGGETSWWYKNIDEVAIFDTNLSESQIEGLFLRGAGKFNISVQSCDDSACSGESWNATYTTSPQNLSVIDNQYFQYRIDLGRNDWATLLTPEVWNVTIGYTVTGGNGTTNPFSLNIEDYGMEWVKLNWTYTP